MKVSIVISTYNREEYIEAALNSLRDQTLGYEDFEVILVNNNSTDSTENICRKFQKNNPTLDFKYFLEKKQGLSYARNRGIEETSGDIVVFLDDDAEALPDYLENLINHFKSNQLLVGGGKIIPKWETGKPKWMSRFLEPLVSVIDYSKKKVPFKQGKYPIGANMFFHKSIFEKVGLFNTELGRTGKNLMGGEEKDIFARVSGLSIPIMYLPDVVVWHNIPVERISKAFIKKQATGIGMSEYLRCKDSKSKYISRLLLEAYKWGGSIVLFFIYFASLQFGKGNMIINFRYLVTKGLLNLQN